MRMKTGAAAIEAFGVGIGIGIGIVLFDSDPDTDSDPDSDPEGLLFTAISGQNPIKIRMFIFEKMSI
jgi:hypothetical protein